MSISEAFKSLYQEYFQVIRQRGLPFTALHHDNTPVVDFQFARGSLGENYIDVWKSLPSYQLLVSEIAAHKGIAETDVDIPVYGLFCYLFSDVCKRVTPPVIQIGLYNRSLLDVLEFDEDRLAHAVLNAVNSDSYFEKSERCLAVFENIQLHPEIDSIDFGNGIRLIPLSKDLIRDQMMARHSLNSEWSRVYAGFELSKDLVEDMETIPILSCLMRIFNGTENPTKKDLRYKGVYREVDHVIHGKIFINYKNTSSESDYHEHLPYKETWHSYFIRRRDVENLVNHISENFSRMKSMTYSAITYNSIPSVATQLRIPLQFFVIESFFADVDSEVTFRISLYVTNILGKDSSYNSMLKKLYAIRSKIAHGDTSSASKLVNGLHNSGFINTKSYASTFELLDSVIVELWFELLSKSWNPKKSIEGIKPYLFPSNENQIDENT